MNMDLITIFSVLIIHWFADFVMQTDEQAQGKSKSWYWLLSHTLTYSGVWYFAAVFVIGHINPNETTAWYVISASAFSAITFLCHTATDYFTSRLNSKLWQEKKVHYFFVSIGFDQILHYVQLFLTLHYLTK